MGSVLAACAGEDVIRYLPFVAAVALVVWALLIYVYGGCRPFWLQLCAEVRALLWPTRTAALPGAAAAGALLGAGGEERGYDGRWGYVAPPFGFAPPISQSLIRALAAEAPGPGVIANEFFCPITRDIMRDPVIAADGRTYEYEAIRRHISRGASRSSPVTGDVLDHVRLTQNHALRSMIVSAPPPAPGGSLAAPTPNTVLAGRRMSPLMGTWAGSMKRSRWPR